MEGPTSKEIMAKLPQMTEFFQYLGYSGPTFIDKGLDSYWGFMNHPIQIEYDGEMRTCIQIKYQLIGGIIFVFSGKMGIAAFDDVHTDYDFNIKYQRNDKWKHSGKLLEHEFRDFKLKKLINN